jgi:hypothetical protein
MFKKLLLSIAALAALTGTMVTGLHVAHLSHSYSVEWVDVDGSTSRRNVSGAELDSFKAGLADTYTDNQTQVIYIDGVYTEL